MKFKKGRRPDGLGCRSDLAGKTFNRLTPIILDEGIVDGGYIWKCKCICGNIKSVPARYLLKGDVKSCGCLKEEIIKNRCFKGFGDIGLDYWSSIINGAKSRNVKFDISIEYAWILFLKQNKRCALSNLKLNFKSKSLGYGSASLDRINSDEGYVYGNVQWVHKDINLIKNKFKEDTLKDFCFKIKTRYSSNLDFEPIDESYLTDDFLIGKYGYSSKGLKISLNKSGRLELSDDHFRSIKHSAEKRGFAFELTKDQIWNLYLKQGGRCNLSGVKVSFSRNTRKVKQTASLDRINSSKGYTLDNVQILHKHVNIMKNTFSQEQFIRYAILIDKYKDKDKFPFSSVMVSGGFDCAHKGHYRMFKEATNFGLVIAGLNSDDWLLRKKGYVFMSFDERKEILESSKYIDVVVAVDDSDDTVCNALESIRPDFFANGGDRKSDNVPEVKVCKKLNIDLLWNVGGDKIQSSSKLVENLNETENL